MVRIKIILYTLFFGLLGCAEVAEKNVDPYIQDIIKGKDELPIKSVTTIPVDEHEIFMPMHPRRDSHGNYIIVNQPINGERSLYLIGSDGQLLAKTGRDGRGPGEFNTINHVELTEDNQLFVLDLGNNKILHFEVTSSDIVFQNEFSMNRAELGGHFRSIHKINSIFWGVLATTGFPSQLVLVELDNSFRLKREHLKIPIHFPNIHFSQSQRFSNAGWSSNSQTFNYFLFDSLVVHSYDVEKETLSRHPLHSPHVHRPQTAINKEFIAKRYGGESPPLPPGNTQSNLVSSEFELVQLHQVLRDDNLVLGCILNYGEEFTYLLLHDARAVKTKYIRLPYPFFCQAFVDSIIIGMKSTEDEDSQLIVIRI